MQSNFFANPTRSVRIREDLARAVPAISNIDRRARPGAVKEGSSKESANKNRKERLRNQYGGGRGVRTETEIWEGKTVNVSVSAEVPRV